MKLLVLGFSNIFQRRVLPVLGECGVERVDIASESGRPVPDNHPLVGGVFGEYRQAIRSSGTDAVYISTTNERHAPLAREALSAGLHVIVDKPAAMSLGDAVELAGLAVRNNRCLAEATVFGAHPQIRRAREIFRENGVRPTRISSTFSIPPLGDDNFRYRKALGGGAIADTGVYAVVPGRLFFETAPTAVHARITSRGAEVETGYSLLMDFGKGRALVGHFGFDTEYRNWIEILGPGLCVRFDRAFTTTPELENVLTVIRANAVSTETAQAGDSFAIFFGGVIRDIGAGDFRQYAQAMLEDAQSVDMLRRAARQ
ncbi:MAG: Gfo/Idh/MocA family oxidoreductase [Desulfovibrionaceae bacterium]|nr:Gfo/Idh/MocA family oxidoreductase [Desulfovibrionaceae bacterium]